MSAGVACEIEDVGCQEVKEAEQDCVLATWSLGFYLQSVEAPREIEHNNLIELK